MQSAAVDKKARPGLGLPRGQQYANPWRRDVPQKQKLVTASPRLADCSMSKADHGHTAVAPFPPLTGPSNLLSTHARTLGYAVRCLGRPGRPPRAQGCSMSLHAALSAAAACRSCAAAVVDPQRAQRQSALYWRRRSPGL